MLKWAMAALSLGGMVAAVPAQGAAGQQWRCGADGRSDPAQRGNRYGG